MICPILGEELDPCRAFLSLKSQGRINGALDVLGWNPHPGLWSLLLLRTERENLVRQWTCHLSLGQAFLLLFPSSVLITYSLRE